MALIDIDIEDYLDETSDISLIYEVERRIEKSPNFKSKLMKLVLGENQPKDSKEASTADFLYTIKPMGDRTILEWRI